ncbi:MAG: glycosyl hydrolase family 30, partial [Lutibacter sp.]|nr:glycosyl hydrolase family 30 [Lutibacter sp.]
MKTLNYCIGAILFFSIGSCTEKPTQLSVEVFETSVNGNKLKRITEFSPGEKVTSIKILPEEKFQTITGFGGAFTESSAYLLNKVSAENRKKIIDAYFSENGANYSLTRTHMNSCDFSVSNYSYTPVAGDKELEHFSIQEDKDDLIPFIKDA